MKINDIFEGLKSFFLKIDSLPLLNKKPGRKFLIIAFGVIFLIIAIFSAAVCVSEFRQREEITETDSSTESTFVSQKDEIAGNFLLVLTRDNAEDITLLSLVRIDSLSGEITFSFLSPATECYVNGQQGSMQEHLEKGGINELLWAVGEYADISIERYIWGDEENFIDWMKGIGTIQVNIEETVSYSHNGISYIIEQGLQNLTADTMLKYFVYLCENRDTQTAKLVDIMLVFASEMFAGEEDNTEKSLNEIVANFTTNISVVDCSGYKSAIRSMATSLSEVKITVVDDLSVLG